MNDLDKHKNEVLELFKIWGDDYSSATWLMGKVHFSEDGDKAVGC